jgi:hypothetical protein
MVPSAAQRRQLDAHAAAELQFDLDAVMARTEFWSDEGRTREHVAFL